MLDGDNGIVVRKLPARERNDAFTWSFQAIDPRTTKAPIVLTLNGVSELVVQSAEGYQELLDRLEELETEAAILTGLQELREGKGVPALPALAALRKKLKQELNQ